MNKIAASSQSEIALRPHSIEVENLENATLYARQRAIKTHQILKSRYLYETGGWKNLFENATSQQLESETISTESETEDSCINLSQSNSNLNLDTPRKKQRDLETLPLCPSVQLEMGNPVIFGVVEGTAESPKIAYLTESQAVTEETLALSTPAKPSEVFRMASTCLESGCKHFDGNDCRLVKGIVDRLPSVVDTLPACQIRPDCRWWQQEGKLACFRCPQIVTDNYSSSEIIQQVSNPNNYETES